MTKDTRFNVGTSNESRRIKVNSDKLPLQTKHFLVIAEITKFDLNKQKYVLVKQLKKNKIKSSLLPIQNGHILSQKSCTQKCMLIISSFDSIEAHFYRNT